MKAISHVLGFIAAMLVMVLTLVFLIRFGSMSIRSNHLMAYLISCSVLAVIAMGLIQAITLATFVALLRGTSTVSWVWPTECSSVSRWFHYSWSFASPYGYQEGQRLLGLEMAVKGQLN